MSLLTWERPRATSESAPPKAEMVPPDQVGWSGIIYARRARIGQRRTGGFRSSRPIFLISKPRPTEGVGHLWRGGCGGRPGAYPPPTDLAHRIWVTARAPSALRRPSSTPRSGGRATGGAKRRSYLASSEGVFVLHCKLHGIDLCNLLILARQTQINKDLGVLPDRKSGI